MENWKMMLDAALEEAGESWADVEANTMTEEEMTAEFCYGIGGTKSCSFTVWTTRSVFFPIIRDDVEFVGRVSRNPDGKPTRHMGGA